MKMNVKIILAGIAFLLGLILALVPQREESISISSLQNQMENPPERVSAYHLAQWIIKGRNDFLVLDIRSKEAYSKNTITDAQHVPLSEIMSFIDSQEVGPQEKMLFVLGKTEAEAAQAALLLKSQGYDAYIIQDGYSGWASLLQPEKPESVTSEEELKEFRKKQTVAAYFRGDGSVEMPTVEIVEPELPEFEAAPRRPATSEGC